MEDKLERNKLSIARQVILNFTDEDIDILLNFIKENKKQIKSYQRLEKCKSEMMDMLYDEVKELDDLIFKKD